MNNLHMQTDGPVSRELSMAAGPWDTRLWRTTTGSIFVSDSGQRPHRLSLRHDPVPYGGFTSVSYIGGSNKKLESLFLSMTLHMHYLRSIGTANGRVTCVNYIRTWLLNSIHTGDIVQNLMKIIRARRTFRGTTLVLEVPLDGQAVWLDPASRRS